MRPARFQRLLALAVDNDEHMTATTYAEAGITRSLWGLILTGPPSADVQIAARSAIGDDYTQPETIVTGATLPFLGAPKPEQVEGIPSYLAMLVNDVAPGEIARAEVHRVRPSGEIPYGATFNFHDGSAIFLYIREI